MTQVLTPSHEILKKIAAEGSVEPEEPMLLEDVSWELYEEFLDELDLHHRHVRVTYDEGRMEIMTLGFRHEQNKVLLGRLVEIYGLEMNLEVTGAGSITLKKPKQKGLEPDECYYIQTAPPGIEVMAVNLSQYPPPDLAIEVDISRSSIPRQPVYAFIAVPEVWRFDGERVIFLHRQTDGQYAVVTNSRALPKLSSADVNRFISMSGTMSQSAVVRAFRDWLNK